MLPVRIFSKSIRSQITLPLQWLNITVRLGSSSTSSSDSSSDSDSDNEKKQEAKKVVDKVNTQKVGETELNTLLNNMLNVGPPSKKMNVAIKSRKKQAEKGKAEQKPFETKLTAAAENVAEALGGDKQKVTSELLKKLLNIDETDTKAKPMHLNNVISNMLEQKVERGDRQGKYWKKKRSIIHELVEQAKSGPPSPNKEQQYEKRVDKNVLTEKQGQPLFGKIADPNPNVPELKVWTELEEKERQLLITRSPENVFQELIQWTEEGKLWKFPIDNEQGMEKEQNVHFSEHVFMERHLKEWCPTKGPVRHFMELVCVGLSKNAFMTVEEKVEHIMWYKEYFEDKRNLLLDLGAIEAESANTAKKIGT